MIGFLFDIDGCLTLPHMTKSVLDIELMDRLLPLDTPIALVTGRSDGWLRKQYSEQNRMNYLDFPTYIEFGLATINGESVQLQQQATEFLDHRLDLIQSLAEVCDRETVYFEPDTWYHDYPSHGSLWVERKHIQLSIAENTNVPTTKVHDLCDLAWNNQDSVRILKHHLGIDVIPQGWSKAQATSHFTQGLNQADYSWYVFGDNSSDREMMEGLDTVTFISTREEASKTVRATLEDLGMISF
ncbi:MAG: HAD hydrolase family protein [Candidatus Kariarchaeaceae archaeon]|jgi:HAD superfamily hydrolase (TIGR01484 family)